MKVAVTPVFRLFSSLKVNPRKSIRQCVVEDDFTLPNCCGSMRGATSLYIHSVTNDSVRRLANKVRVRGRKSPNEVGEGILGAGMT